jgi:hypothetical protein
MGGVGLPGEGWEVVRLVSCGRCGCELARVMSAVQLLHRTESCLLRCSRRKQGTACVQWPTMQCNLRAGCECCVLAGNLGVLSVLRLPACSRQISELMCWLSAVRRHSQVVSCGAAAGCALSETHSHQQWLHSFWVLPRQG